MINENIADDCIDQGIYDVLSCEDYLNLVYTTNECEDHEPPIIDADECEDYLLEKYNSNVDCNYTDKSLCSKVLEDNFLNRLVIEQNNQELITGIIDPLIGKVIELKYLNIELEKSGIEDILPIYTDEKENIYLANSQEEIILEDANTLTVLNKAVIMLDDDGDGLPNDLEKYYGTDKNNPDSDNDGYLDSEEINNNYNPLGTGSLNKSRINLDKVILNNLPLEQPKKVSSKISKNFQVDNIENYEDNLVLSGNAEPNAWVSIYLYSDLPLVMITKTDDDGNWSYTVKNSLVDGDHKVYVTLNDNTGKIIKQSNALSFLIKEAKAVSAADYFDSTSTPDKTNSMVLYYILGSIFLILLSLGVIMYLHKKE